MTGAESLTAPSALEGLQAAYERGVTDEFVEPFSILGKEGSIASGDSLVCFNFRPDRAREITRAFADPSFTEVTRRDGELPVTVASMTEYDATLPIPVAFPPEHIADTLAETVSKRAFASYILQKRKNTPTLRFSSMVGGKKFSLGKTASLFRRRMSRPMTYSLR